MVCVGFQMTVVMLLVGSDPEDEMQVLRLASGFDSARQKRRAGIRRLRSG